MPGLSFYDKQHIQKVAAQQAVIANIFNQFILSVSPYLRKWSDTGKNNVWIQNNSVENAVDKELLTLQSLLQQNIELFQFDAWKRSDMKNDDFIREYIKGMAISSAVKEGMFAHSMSAFSAFQKDVDAQGLRLSDRVWNITQQTKSQLEFYLNSGIATGRSSNEISRDMRQLLDKPDKRFRRIRNDEGKLVLSRPMKDYHPGQGVYRSAKMNALRTSSTTTNAAYRTADYERWSNQDFVLGIEIHRSANNRGPCKICDAMVGRYPKTFKFTGFHPFCICFATPITMEPENFADFLLNDTVPKEQVITDIPQGAKDFVSENKDGLQSAFWYKDNFTKDASLQKNLISQANDPDKIKVPSSKRIKTNAEKADIQQRWDDRFVKDFNQTRIEQKLGIKRGNDMTFEDANELRGNISYGKSEEYGVNCQSCVVANELRRRGYDVTALPNLKKESNIPYELSGKTNWAWIDPKTMMIPEKKKAGGQYVSGMDIKSKTLIQLNKELNKLTKDIGRYHIDFMWKGSDGGHIITVDRLENGSIRIYDPQTGRLGDWKVISKEISLKYGVNVLRVDNLLVNTDIIDGVVRKL